jgi:hypothetical protein
MAQVQKAVFEIEREEFEDLWPLWFSAHRQEFGSLSKWAIVLGTTVTSVTNWSKPKSRGGNVPKGYYMLRICHILDADYTDVLAYGENGDKRRHLVSVGAT